MITNRSPELLKEINSLRSTIKITSDILDSSKYTDMINEVEDKISSYTILRGFNQMKAVSIYEVLNKIYEELTK